MPVRWAFFKFVSAQTQSYFEVNNFIAREGSDKSIEGLGKNTQDC